MTLVPAYGRDYKSKAEVLADWNANKDFLIADSGRYINKQDVDTIGIGEPLLTFRFSKLMKVFLLKV